VSTVRVIAVRTRLLAAARVPALVIGVLALSLLAAVDLLLMLNGG
jgi:hypothetical protein